MTSVVLVNAFKSDKVTFRYFYDIQTMESLPEEPREFSICFPAADELNQDRVSLSFDLQLSPNHQIIPKLSQLA